MAGPTAPPSIYPELQTATPIATTDSPDNTFRLEEISQLKKYLEGEVETRAALYKKYCRGVNVIDVIDGTLVVASMGLGACGIGLLTTIIAAPVVNGLEAAALVCGLGRVTGKFVSCQLAVKAQKHDEIRVLAKSKANSIASHVSAALQDGNVSDEELKLIIEEVKRYKQMKAHLCAAARKKHTEVELDQET